MDFLNSDKQSPVVISKFSLRKALSGLCLALVLPLASCVTDGQNQAAVSGPSKPRGMERVVNTGYSLIASRYIDPVENKALSLFALRGLGVLDPAIEIDDLPNAQIGLRMGDKQLISSARVLLCQQE